MIIQTSNFKEWSRLVPADGRDVWLSISECHRPTSTPGAGIKIGSLDLMGLAQVEGERTIVWLSMQGMMRGIGNTLTQDNLVKARQLVEKVLKDLGYNVRNGRYGIPQSRKAFSAEIEFLRWERNRTGGLDVHLVDRKADVSQGSAGDD